MTPTVVSEVTRQMTIANDEVFGPVLSALTFDDLAEAFSIANGTHYGLSAGIWTISLAHKTSQQVNYILLTGQTQSAAAAKTPLLLA